MDKTLIKKNVIEGVRVGIIAFLICFFTVGLVASIINGVFLDDINRILNGSLSTTPKASLSNFLLLISVIMNLTVFNSGGALQNGGSLHIGLLVLIALPLVAFIIADRRDNKKNHFNHEDMIIYSVSSAVFSLTLFIFSMIAKGRLLGIEVDFSKLMNLVMTMIIIMTIQFFIGLNYNKAFSPGIKKTRILLRIFMGIGLLFGVIGLFVLLGKFISNLFIVILGTLILLPNIAIYIMFTFMGGSMQFSEQLQKLMLQGGIDISFATLPIAMRFVFIVTFFVVVFISVWKLEKEHYLEELILFATSYSLISLIFAYMTKINLGFVKNLLDVQFGFDYVFAFVVPFAVILLAGLIVLLVRFIKHEVEN